MSTPRVSVVIPTYNRQDLVTEAIESVLTQTFSDFEIIVVDDGSTDETSSRMKAYEGRVTYHVQKNQGVAAARNAGIRLARGEFVCFLDSDDLWEPSKLATQIHFAEAHPEYALVATEIQGFDSNSEKIGSGKASLYTIRNGMVAEHLLFGNWIQTSTVMLRRTALDEVGWFDEDIGQFGEDWLLWMRVASRFPIYFLPEPLVSYRFHPGRLTLYQPEEQFQSLMRCVKKMEEFPEFQKNPDLLRRHEYRICISRGKGNLAAGHYDLAEAKLQRAYGLARFPVLPAYLLLRTAIQRIVRKSPAN